MNKTIRIKELVNYLNLASDKYYNSGQSIISDKDYDRLYDELLQLEKETGFILPSSPSENIGYEIKSNLNKIQHEIPLKSLNKTKSIDELKGFLRDKEGVLMLKLDGLTNKLTYEQGIFKTASTRGNGYIGEEIGHNAKQYKNISNKINSEGSIDIVGEAIIKQVDFLSINSKLDNDNKFKNSRNLVSGTIRSLNSRVVAQRGVNFIAFGIVAEEEFKYKEQELEYLISLGFDVVPFMVVDRYTLESAIGELKKYADDTGLPIDGMVLTFNDKEYGKSLGETSKFPKHSLAFKFYDETVQTKLIEVEWNTSRQGRVVPTAIFETVELEGTEVSRATLNNVTFIKDLKLGIGDILEIRKANQIIPQVVDNITRSNTLEIPKICPYCGMELKLVAEVETAELYCCNPSCEAQLSKVITHYASRDCMNIKNLSEKTIQVFIEQGIIKGILSLYHLEDYKKEIIRLGGMGEKKYFSIIKGVENSRKDVELFNLLFALGIEQIGLGAAKEISKFYDNDIDRLLNSNLKELMSINKVNSTGANNLYRYISNEDNRKFIIQLQQLIEFKEAGPVVETNINNNLQGRTFVITGKLEKFKNRNELVSVIEKNGGIIGKSVGKTTSYLINNDVESNSSKNKKAKDLSIPIISESDFLKMVV